jgi:hypothetical protein
MINLDLCIKIAENEIIKKVDTAIGFMSDGDYHLKNDKTYNLPRDWEEQVTRVRDDYLFLVILADTAGIDISKYKEKFEGLGKECKRILENNPCRTTAKEMKKIIKETYAIELE